MRGVIALTAVPVLTALAAPALVTPAYADGPPPSADLRVVYGSPEIAANGSGVTWHWVLTNTGAGAAETVVATHRVSPDQKIVGISAPCSGTGGNAVVCSFGEIKPGEKRAGWIRTSVASVGGTLRVNAQVTWHENPNVMPGADEPPVDAGTTPDWDSWGMSDTGAATDTPRQNG